MLTTADPVLVALTPPRRSRAFVRALREPAVAAGAVILLLFLLAALFAPVISPFDPLDQNIAQGLKPPSFEHLLGTDKLGRDILSRLLYGARISLLVGLAVVAGAGSIGTLIGLLAGYIGEQALGLPPSCPERDELPG